MTLSPDRPTPVRRPSRRALLAGAAALAPLVSLGSMQSAFADTTYHSAAGLDIIGQWPHEDIRSVDFRFQTDKVRTFPPSVRVTLPESYAAHPDRRYPVLLLLHGCPGFFLDWTEKGGDAVGATAKHEVITVMPDGGAGNFYINTNAPRPGCEAAWETFIMEQVLGFVHANFRTDPARMAIAGLSMGGWGALSLGQRYWGHFRSISSYSGPADCNPINPDGLGVAAAIWACPLADAAKYPLNTNLPGSTFGVDSYGYTPLVRSYNPIENIDRYRGKRIFLRSGTGPWLEQLRPSPRILDEIQKELGESFGDIVEQDVHSNLNRFSRTLKAANIDHDYQVIDGATHEWNLWNQNLVDDLPGIMKALNA